MGGPRGSIFHDLVEIQLRKGLIDEGVMGHVFAGSPAAKHELDMEIGKAAIRAIANREPLEKAYIEFKG
ncbi:MAG TPA: hypothetical protein VFF09_02470, partial [archaeon]|nr:hypothetical protein [archaeon]